MSLSQWREHFAVFAQMRLSKLTVSGGEPTLYPDLISIIKEGKKYGWEMRINTNGSLIDQAFAVDLLNNGLDIVSLSVYSSRAELHDRLRNHRGLWEKAMGAMEIFSGLRDLSFPSFRMNMQTLITKDNFREFPDLIRMAFELRVCSITFSYLEGDYKNKQHLLDKEEIREFREELLPAAEEVIRSSMGNKITKKMGINALHSIYPTKKVSSEQYADGIYRVPAPCVIPQYFALILASGDVLPCPMVEYTHFPIVGNLFKIPISDIWPGNGYKDFRKKGFDFCRYCPVPEQVTIPVNRKPEMARLQNVIKGSVLSPFYPRIKRFVFSKKNLLKTVRRR